MEEEKVTQDMESVQKAGEPAPKPVRKKSKVARIIRIVCLSITCVNVIVIAVILIGPSINESKRKQLVYTDMQQSMDENVLSANIRIAMEKNQEIDNVISTSSQEMGCGVIFEEQDGYYYVLTAEHVAEADVYSGVTAINGQSDFEVTMNYYIMPYGSDTYAQAKEKATGFISSEEFYEQYAPAEVVYTSENCDLAILRFHSDEQYGCLNIAETSPARGERMAVFGKDETGSVIRYGKILTGRYVTFKTSDGYPDSQTLAFNAYVQKGYSGGAVINEQMEIAGITIGGTQNLLNKFLRGYMIPAEVLQEEIEVWHGTVE